MVRYIYVYISTYKNSACCFLIEKVNTQYVINNRCSIVKFYLKRDVFKGTDIYLHYFIMCRHGIKQRKSHSISIYRKPEYNELVINLTL